MLNEDASQNPLHATEVQKYHLIITIPNFSFFLPSGMVQIGNQKQFNDSLDIRFP